MKNFSKFGIVTTLTVLLVVGLVAPLATPNVARAATSPSLGDAATYGIVSSTYTNSLNTGSETSITGDVCYTTEPDTAPVSISGATNVPCSAAVGTAQASALASLNSQSCTPITGALEDVIIGGNAPGTIPPGCYSMVGALNVTLSTTVTLDVTAPGGTGSIWIFRPSGALNTGANSIIALENGASACNVFWTPGGDATLGANASTSATPTFVGTIIPTSPADIYVGHFANVLGRLLAYGETVTTDSNTIVVPTGCAVASASTSSGNNTITVVKNVVNDSGGTAVFSDFPLFINGNPVTSGQSTEFTAGTYTVTETNSLNYTTTFSGDCNANGQINHGGADTQNSFCIITNNDIGAPKPVVPPLIDVVKVPSPLSLPNGPGPVTYTYTLRNVGTVPVTNITMVGDSCNPIVRVSGDTNNNSILEVSETWVHTCSTTLSSTHTNIVTTTGWANGISTVDIATATVVVGSPLVPPIIHVTKVPNRFVAYQGRSGVGDVMYVYNITNPGTVAMSNVTLSDDKCASRFGPYGDTNNDGLLDTNESWAYACLMNVTATITNTAVATGFANGFTARDFAIVTVVVTSAPVVLLPNTGLAAGHVTGIAMLIGILMLASISFLTFAVKRVK